MEISDARPGIYLAGLESCLGTCSPRQDHTGAWTSVQSNGLSAILLGARRGSWVVKGSQVTLAGSVRGWPPEAQRKHCQQKWYWTPGS